MELLKEAHEAVKLDADEFSPQELEAGDRAIDERMAFLDQYLAFVPGVKFITKEKRFDRALPWFRRFIRSRVQTEKKRDAVIAGARAKGFDFYELETLPGYFAEWKAGEKSRTAQRERGRVRSKGDKRMGARLPSLI